MNGVRARTVVYGLVMLVIAFSVMLRELFGLHVSSEAVALILVTGSGAALVAAGITSGIRDARRHTTPTP